MLTAKAKPKQDTVSRILVTLKVLRHEHKCVLPVQVFSFPGEIRNQAHVRALAALGATVKEVSSFPAYHHSHLTFSKLSGFHKASLAHLSNS